MIAEEKRKLRAEIRARMAGVGRRELAGERVVERLLDSLEWRKSNTVLGYLALGDEIDISGALRAALESGKRVALPRYYEESGTYCAAEYRGEDLKTRRFGIGEPAPDAPEVPLKRLDFVLVPGVGFDRSGRRLGRGKGYYDRLLAEVTGVKCGVAFDEQIVELLPSEPHDVAMDLILTPTRWIDLRFAGT